MKLLYKEVVFRSHYKVVSYRWNKDVDITDFDDQLYSSVLFIVIICIVVARRYGISFCVLTWHKFVLNISNVPIKILKSVFHRSKLLSHSTKGNIINFNS